MCHSEPVITLAWESVFLRCKAPRRLRRQGMRIATPACGLVRNDTCGANDYTAKLSFMFYCRGRGSHPTLYYCGTLMSVQSDTSIGPL